MDRCAVTCPTRRIQQTHRREWINDQTRRLINRQFSLQGNAVIGIGDKVLGPGAVAIRAQRVLVWILVPVSWANLLVAFNSQHAIGVTSFSMTAIAVLLLVTITYRRLATKRLRRECIALDRAGARLTILIAHDPKLIENAPRVV